MAASPTARDWEDRANAALSAGDLAAAGSALDTAASAYALAGRTDDEARMEQLAATVWRAGGDTERAAAAVARVLELAPQSPAAVVAWTERGELAVAAGEMSEAATAYGEALALATALAFPAGARAAIMRKRGLARWSVGERDAAVADLEAATALLAGADGSSSARAVEAERVGALFELGDQRALGALGAAREHAESANDRRALADIDLLEAAHHEKAGDRDAAFDAATRARDNALAAVAPMTYVAAVLAIAALADALGRRADAYGALASGWVTLADLLGGDIGRATFEPALRDLRDRWGEDAFAGAKAEYESRRRAR